MTISESDAWQAFLASLPPELRALYDDPSEDVAEIGDRRVSLTEALEVLSEQVARPPGVGERAVRQDRHGAGLLAAAGRHAAFGQARAVLVLLEAGLQAEAMANARACLEQAVAVRRLALAADAGELEPLLTEIAYQAEQRRDQQLKYLEGLDAAAGGPHRALLQAARRQHEANRTPRDKTRPKARLAKDVFEGVPGGAGLYSAYNRLSESTHAGLGSAEPYLMPALRADGRVPVSPEQGAWAETALLLCWSCWAADDAMLRFLVDGADVAARQVELLARVGLAPG